VTFTSAPDLSVYAFRFPALEIYKGRLSPPHIGQGMLSRVSKDRGLLTASVQLVVAQHCSTCDSDVTVGVGKECSAVDTGNAFLYRKNGSGLQTPYPIDSAVRVTDAGCRPHTQPNKFQRNMEEVRRCRNQFISLSRNNDL
jgi:hypothetical protein